MVRPANDITVCLNEVAALAAVERRPPPVLRTLSLVSSRPAAAVCEPVPAPRAARSLWSQGVSKQIRSWAEQMAPAGRRPDPRPTCRSCGQGPVSTIGADDRNGFRLTRGRCVKCRAEWALQHDGSQLLAPW